MPSAGREFPLLPPRFPPRCSMFPRTREPGALLSFRRRPPPFRRPGEGPDPALVSSSLGLVIPTEAGIRFDFALALPFRGRVGWGWCWFWFSALSRKPTHVPVFFRPPSLAAESLSLARARESNQREHALAVAVAGASMPLRLREQAPGFDGSTSLCSRRTRAHRARARAARGNFLHLLAAAERGSGRAERGSPCRRSSPTRTRHIPSPSFRRRPESSSCCCICSALQPSKAAAKGGR